MQRPDTLGEGGSPRIQHLHKLSPRTSQDPIQSDGTMKYPG